MPLEVWHTARAYRESVGAPWFTKPWDLNLLIARTQHVGLWDDLVLVCCTDDANRPVSFACVATGDAWSGEWLTPKHPDGCIYVLDQHVAGGYAPGLHHNRRALIQQRDFRCVRWPASRNRVPSVPELQELGATAAFTANRGTHLHNRVSDHAPAQPRPGDSEGCTVNLYYHEHLALMRLVEQQKRRHGTDIVSPTFCLRSELGL